MTERLGYNVHQIYYDATVAFHMDAIVGLVKPGTIAIPEDALFEMPEYLKNNFDVIWTPRDEAAQNFGCNMVNVNDNTVILNSRAEKTIKLLKEKAGVNVEAIEYQIGADLGTGPWCSMCAIWRE